MNRRFAEQQYNLYLWYAPWAVAEASNVHGILGPTLPDGAEPGRQLVSGHPLIGVWIDAACPSGQDLTPREPLPHKG